MSIDSGISFFFVNIETFEEKIGAKKFSLHKCVCVYFEIEAK